MIVRFEILTGCIRVGTVSCVVSLLSAVVVDNLSATSAKSSTYSMASKTSSTYSSLIILRSASIVLLVNLRRINILSYLHHNFIRLVVILIMSYRLTKCAEQIFRCLNIFLQ